MTLEAKYFSPTTPGAATFTEDVTSAIRLGSITGLSGEAQMGAVGEGNIVLDDPGSTIGHAGDGIVGLKQFYFNETACPAGNRRLWTGYIADRRYHRGTEEPSGTPSSLILGADRKIDVTLQDTNAFLGFRVFAPTADDPTSDFVRPAETDLERVAALLTDVDFLSTTLFDIGYIPTTGGVAMDANDYTGQRPIDVLNDCAQASGRNFFVLYDEGTNQYVLWYDRWTSDGTATLAYDSALRLTNVNSEYDGTTTFAISPDAVEVLDPSRVVSAVYDTYTGGVAYRTRPTTAYTYAWRDSAPISSSVKTLAKAQALADRYLTENATEDAKISCTVRLPASKVTGIHEGMRLEVHFTHLPIVNTGFTWTRVLQRTIRQDQETTEFYWLDLELSPIPTLECSTGSVLALSDTGSPHTVGSGGPLCTSIPAPSGGPAILIGLMMLEQADANLGPDGDNITIGAPWTRLVANPLHGYDHDMCSIAYLAISGGTSDNLCGSWAGRVGEPQAASYEILGCAIQTSATAPVQQAIGNGVQPGAGPTVVLPSPPTEGNLLLMCQTNLTGFAGPLAGWTTIFNVEMEGIFPTSDAMYCGIFARCVEADESATIPNCPVGSENFVSISEWAMA